VKLVEKEAFAAEGEAEAPALARLDSVPLYLQVKHRLEAEIRDGRYRPGTALPTEPQLCELYGVSRITVRRAISELQDEGLLEKRHGKGTFVSVERLESSLVQLEGFSETYSSKGVEFRSTLLEMRRGSADDTIAAKLGLLKDMPVLHVTRLISTRRGPLTLDRSDFPLDRFPGLERKLADDVSIYRILREDYQRELKHAQRRINVRMARQAERSILGCSLGEPLFEMEKIVYDVDRVPLQRSTLMTPCNLITLTIAF
jgi:GntR family transcriptional regulator, frlABCD operon transcriptional regulator